MITRSHAEMSRRMSLITSVPCPDCGAMLPCGRDEDQETRLIHYRSQCPGKPVPAPEMPMVIGLPDYSLLASSSLRALRLRIRARLIVDQNPARLVGINAILQPAYHQILEAVESELSRREGDK